MISLNKDEFNMKTNPLQIIELETKDVQIREKNIRKSYCKPRLNELGDLRNLTLGPTPGTLESNGPGTLKGI